MFSATFNKDIRHTAKRLFNSNYLIAASDINDYDINRNIEQHFAFVEEKDKPYELHRILQQQNGSAIGKYFIIVINK